MYREPQDSAIDLKSLAGKLFLLLLGISVLFVALDSLQNHVKTLYLGEYFRSIYSIKYEPSIGTWYSVMLNMLAGCIAFFCYLHQRPLHRGQARCWLIIALFFVYLSMDDHVILHEQFGFVFKESIVPRMIEKTYRLPSYGWQFVYGPLFGAMGLFILIFSLNNLSTTMDKRIISAALLLFAAAVILDFWEGSDRYFTSFYQGLSITRKNALHWFRVTEEFFEMLGSILFTYVFLRHLAHQLTIHPRRISWGEKRPE